MISCKDNEPDSLININILNDGIIILIAGNVNIYAKLSAQYNIKLKILLRLFAIQIIWIIQVEIIKTISNGLTSPTGFVTLQYIIFIIKKIVK